MNEWKVCRITLPDRTTFTIAFSDDILRIRKLGWVPAEIRVTANPDNHLHIARDET